MFSRLRTLPALLLGCALAAPPAWEGDAHPVIPPTRCADVLPAARHDASGYHYGAVWAAQPLRVASCWKGTLRGRPFTLTGYSSGEADTAVTVQLSGRTTPLALGTNGSPTVIAFSGSTVCLLPNPAKGFVVTVSLAPPAAHLQPALANQLCRSERVTSAPFGRKVYVAGLKQSYPVGLGVIRTY